MALAPVAMMMFSLAGIPPLAGFWAKWYVFLVAIEARLYVLAVVGVITSVVGAYYYLRIVKVIYFDDATQERVWSRFTPLMTPGATLYIGHSERVSGPASAQLQTAGLTTYRLGGAA